jgi:transcription antitermination protein NusB
MLNRRILRVKAFQNLYAYDQCKASNLNLAKDLIKDSFQPDLNSMEVQDKAQLKKEAAIATDLFVKNLRNTVLDTKDFTHPKIIQAVKDALNFFRQANTKDYDFLSKNMVASAERLPQLYLYAIKLILAFGEHVAGEYERKRKFTGDKVTQTIGEMNLAKNVILEKIRASKEFENACTRNQVDLEELELEIKEWFREYIKPLEEYKAYIGLSNPTAEEDFEITDTILKKVIFQNEVMLNFFSEKDMNWTENKSVVRSLASKVLKNVKSHVHETGEVLPEIALNWEEDKEFFQNIFNLTIQNDDQNRDLIAKKTENWDIERIAQTDKIILSMALTEMQHFPSIPVKVSINEYIDISKTYSTPKSKQFVNGLLDVMSKELTDKGLIRKSGRGLLDNK